MNDADPWARLRRHTTARIALGRAGGSVPTRELLNFQLAHARARDAVHYAADFGALEQQLAEITGLTTLELHSAAGDRTTYLRRPDLGRRLASDSRQTLMTLAQQTPSAQVTPDIALIVGDGLSGLAAERHVPPLLKALLPLLQERGWHLTPLVLVHNARVAIQDEIGVLLGARLSILLLGERPGLGVPDSLAAYFTWGPRRDRHDAERNCLSNIRADGLAPELAAHRLRYLLDAAFRRQLSGVALKDDSPPATSKINSTGPNVGREGAD